MSKRVFIVLFLFSCLFMVQGESPPSGFWHTVTCGETVKIIAEKYGVNAHLIAGVNNLKDWNYILVGEKLWIPKEETAKVKTYIVKRNDYLLKIAADFGVTAWAIAEANGLFDMNTLHTGQSLIIPLQ